MTKAWFLETFQHKNNRALKCSYTEKFTLKRCTYKKQY